MRENFLPGHKNYSSFNVVLPVSHDCGSGEVSSRGTTRGKDLRTFGKNAVLGCCGLSGLLCDLLLMLGVKGADASSWSCGQVHGRGLSFS